MSADKPSSGPTLDLELSCNERQRHVQWSDLPLACPMPGTTLWNAHPRVYLSIHRDGRATCGYCGTKYILDDPPADAPDPNFSNMEIERDYRRARQRAKAASNKG